jgi:hypothetical protein
VALAAEAYKLLEQGRLLQMLWPELQSQFLRFSLSNINLFKEAADMLLSAPIPKSPLELQ